MAKNPVPKKCKHQVSNEDENTNAVHSADRLIRLSIPTNQVHSFRDQPADKNADGIATDGSVEGNIILAQFINENACDNEEGNCQSSQPEQYFAVNKLCYPTFAAKWHNQELRHCFEHSQIMANARKQHKQVPDGVVIPPFLPHIEDHTDTVQRYS
jgi:hypothetical protein